MEQQLLGETTVKLMESLEKEGIFDNSKIIAVGIAVVMEDETEKLTRIRTYSSEDIFHRQLGLFHEAYLTIRGGRSADDDFEEDDDQDD